MKGGRLVVITSLRSVKYWKNICSSTWGKDAGCHTVSESVGK